MAKEKWTPDQLSAIDLRPKKMLVSAAAGSGKTAVLSERIIKRLEDPNADITRFLIVTYTRLAANELRSRIGSKLRDKAVKVDGSLAKHFARQCNRLGSAHISTIHSYCAALVKRNFNKFDPPLPPVLSVCEEAQAIEIKTRLMDELIEFAYSGQFAPIPDFEAFANNFVTANDRSLADEMLKHYQTVAGLPCGFETWKKAADMLASDTPILHTPWGEFLVAEYCRRLKYFLLHYERIINIIHYDASCAKYEAQISGELDALRALYDALLNKDILASIKALSELTFDRLNPPAKDKTTQLERKEFQDGARADLKEFLGKELYPVVLFTSQPASDGSDSAEIRFMRERSAVVAKGLVALLEEFNRLYSEEKRRLGILDFADLEQYTYRLLYDENGNKTPLSHEVSSSFDEIFVDEFQDVNPMQSKIFEALSCDCAIFQVGDIKQSIYGFRGAEPNIFADCRRKYTVLDRKRPETENADELTVFLSANFRSMYPVTSFVNRIFDPLFYAPSDYISCNDRIPYSDGDKLLCQRADSYEDEAKTVLKKGLPPVRMTIIEVPSNRGAHTAAAKEAEGNNTDPIIAKLSADQAECLYVANKIAALRKKGVKGKDIAVVARASTHVALIEEYLLAKGITSSNDKGAPLADMPEVQLALSILSCVDNPHKDIALASALRSPVFGFTLDDLITVRRYKKGVSLFSALRDYAKETNMKKGEYFIEMLDRLRAASTGQPASHVLWQIYVETDFFSLIYDAGKASKALAASRRANLIKLHSLAAQSDNVGRDGIYTFLRRFEHLSGTKNAPTASGVRDENTVRFFTTHGSKGLEFPHCFVCGLGHSTQRSQQKDLSSDVMCDNTLGVAVKLRDSTSIVKTDTPMRKAIAARKKYTQYEEALRVLYVALTRARDNLYVTAAVSSYEKLMNTARLTAELDHPSAVYSLSEPIEWVMTALYTERKGEIFLPPEELKIEKVTEEEIRNGTNDGSIIDDPDNNDQDQNAQDGQNKSGKSDNTRSPQPILPDKATYEMIKARLTAPDAYETSAELPAKISVSRLYPSLLNDEEEEDQHEMSTPAEDVTATENSEFTPADVDVTPKHKKKKKKPTALKTPLFALGARRLGIRDKIAAEADPDAVLKNAVKYNSLCDDLSGIAEKVSAAERGTATHLFMQFCDFEKTEKNGVKTEIDRLVGEQFILPYHAAIIDPEIIKRFMASHTYAELKNSTHVRREVRFNTRLPADKFTTDKEKKKALTEETLLVQGVIDCYYVTKDGKTILLDYKTDSFEDGMSEAEIEKELKKRHSQQLSYYKLALEKLLLRPVDRVEIFSFALGRTVVLSKRK